MGLARFVSVSFIVNLGIYSKTVRKGFPCKVPATLSNLSVVEPI